MCMPFSYFSLTLNCHCILCGFYLIKSINQIKQSNAIFQKSRLLQNLRIRVTMTIKTYVTTQHSQTMHTKLMIHWRLNTCLLTIAILSPLKVHITNSLRNKRNRNIKTILYIIILEKCVFVIN